MRDVEGGWLLRYAHANGASMMAPVAHRPQTKGSALTSHAGRVFLQLLPLRGALLSRRRLRDAEPFSSQVHAVIHGKQLVPEPSVRQRYAVLPICHARILHIRQRNERSPRIMQS